MPLAPFEDMEDPTLILFSPTVNKISLLVDDWNFISGEQVPLVILKEKKKKYAALIGAQDSKRSATPPYILTQRSPAVLVGHPYIDLARICS